MSASRCRLTLSWGRDGASRSARLLLRLAPPLLLAGCNYAANPLVGFPHFIGDTHTFRTVPNVPPGTEETLLRSQGTEVSPPALLPDAGNVWPGPPPPIPSLADIQNLQNQNEQLPPANVPSIAPPSNYPSSVPPGSTTPPAELYRPQQPLPPIQTPGELRTPTPPPVSGTIPPPAGLPPTVSTPSGALINNGRIGGAGSPSSATNPVTGGQSIVVPNGNGTSTVIAPDGSTQIIPTPK